MVRTTANANDVLGETELPRLQAIQSVALHDSTTQLVLLSGTPRVNVPLLVQRKYVVGTASQVFDFLEGGNKRRGCLNKIVGVKAENSVVALYQRVITQFFLVDFSFSLTRKVPHP